MRVRLILRAGSVFGFVRRAFSWMLLIAGLVLIAIGGREFFESKTEQNEISEEWKHAVTESRPEKGEEPAARILRPGEAVAKLSIPRLDAEWFVVEGTGKRELRRGPGHLAGSAMPGERGNCVIAGHRDTHFRVLRHVRKGDELLLDDERGRQFRYRVISTHIVQPTDTQLIQPTSRATVDLVTCYPFYYVGPAPQRFVVRAQAEEKLASARKRDSRRKHIVK